MPVAATAAVLGTAAKVAAKKFATKWAAKKAGKAIAKGAAGAASAGMQEQPLQSPTRPDAANAAVSQHIADLFR